MTAKTAAIKDDNILSLDDIVREKNEADLMRETTDQQRSPQDGENLSEKRGILRLHRTMSDPVSFRSEYLTRAKQNRCVECLYSYRLCGSQHKHTHFPSSRQVAQSIYPDFLSAIPNESGNSGDLKKKMKHRVLEHSYSSCVELNDSKGPSQKSLMEWYSREYGISVDNSCKESSDST